MRRPIHRLGLLPALILSALMMVPSAFAAGTPHLLYGAIGADEADGPPPDGGVEIDVRIIDRPDELITEADIGCGYEAGHWWAEVANFPTPWRAGERVEVTLRDLDDGDRYTGEVALTQNNVQSIALTRLPAPGAGPGDDDEPADEDPPADDPPADEPDPGTTPDTGGNAPISSGSGGAGDTNNCFVRTLTGNPGTAARTITALGLLAAALVLIRRRRKGCRRLPLLLVLAALITVGWISLTGSPDAAGSNSATYSLTPGWNGITIPFADTGIHTADDLAEAVPGCDRVRYWDVHRQGFIEHWPGVATTDFFIPAGHPCFVRVSDAADWTVTGTAIASPDFDLYTTGTTGINAIALSLGRIDISDAEDLAGVIPHCEGVWYWDPEAGGYVGHPAGTPINNFPVRPGRPYFVGVTEPGIWSQEALLAIDNDGDGWTEEQGDCDDGNPAAGPGLTEVCDDGIDNDCDGKTDCADPDCAETPDCQPCEDADGDGYFAEIGCGTDPDCDDADPARSPGTAEVCDDGIDNDCDGDIDCDDADCADGEVCNPCVDADGDGFFNRDGCETPVDCDDGNPAIHPDAAEVCDDGIDNDCDGTTDCGDDECYGDPVCISCIDADGDGYFSTAGCGTAVDCNDGNAGVYPGAPEICADGIDQDCDGADDPCMSVSPQSVEVAVGSPATLTIQGGAGPYSISNTHPDVATATLAGSTVTIETHGPGQTTLTVYDSGSYSQEILITVLEPYTVDDGVNRVVIGPVEGATVSVYTLDDLDAPPLESSVTGEKGAFSFLLAGIDPETLLAVRAEGGLDIDANDDGLVDLVATPVDGAVHAFVTAGDLRDGRVRVSAVSEMAFRYAETLLTNTHPDDIKIRLGDIADTLLTQRLADVGEPFEDLGRFNPLSEEHRERLAIDYEALIGADALTGAIHRGLDREAIRERLEAVVGIANFAPHIGIDTRQQPAGFISLYNICVYTFG